MKGDAMNTRILRRNVYIKNKGKWVKIKRCRTKKEARQVQHAIENVDTQEVVGTKETQDNSTS